METILFVHGAWHNESCWKPVVKELKQYGYRGETVTIAGNEPDSSGVNTSYRDMVDSIVRKAGQIEDRFILAAHSSGGHVVQHAAPLFEDKIKQIIFNNAWLLPDKTSQFDLVADEGLKGMMRATAEAHPRKCIPLDEGFFRNALANDASKEIQDELLSILVPQPIEMLETKSDTAAFSRMNIPMSLLYCKNDISLPDGVFKQLFQAAVPGGDIVEIDGGHETLYVNPAIFVEGLLNLVK